MAEDEETGAGGVTSAAAAATSALSGIVAGLLRERALADLARRALRRSRALPSVIVSGSKSGGPDKSVRMSDGKLRHAMAPLARASLLSV